MRLFSALAVVALAVTPLVAIAQAPAPAAPAKPAEKAAFSTESTLGVLMANPAAKEVVIKHVPELAQAADNAQAGGMTIKDVQQYLPGLDEKMMATLDAELAKIPAPKK